MGKWGKISGKFSSKDPNVQQIPKKAAWKPDKNMGYKYPVQKPTGQTPAYGQYAPLYGQYAALSDQYESMVWDPYSPPPKLYAKAAKVKEMHKKLLYQLSYGDPDIEAEQNYNTQELVLTTSLFRLRVAHTIKLVGNPNGTVFVQFSFLHSNQALAVQLDLPSAFGWTDALMGHVEGLLQNYVKSGFDLEVLAADLHIDVAHVERAFAGYNPDWLKVQFSQDGTAYRYSTKFFDVMIPGTELGKNWSSTPIKYHVVPKNEFGADIDPPPAPLGPCYLPSGDKFEQIIAAVARHAAFMVEFGVPEDVLHTFIESAFKVGVTEDLLKKRRDLLMKEVLYLVPTKKSAYADLVPEGSVKGEALAAKTIISDKLAAGTIKSIQSGGQLFKVDLHAETMEISTGGTEFHETEMFDMAMEMVDHQRKDREAKEARQQEENAYAERLKRLQKDKPGKIKLKPVTPLSKDDPGETQGS